MAYRINDPHATKLMMKYALVKAFDPNKDWSIARYDSKDCLMGGAIVDSFTGIGGSAEMHICSFQPRWGSKALIYQAFHYIFNVLNVKKAIGLVPEYNWRAYRLDIHLGFKEEAYVKDVFPWEPSGYLVLSMYRDECRWLKMKSVELVEV